MIDGFSQFAGLGVVPLVRGVVAAIFPEGNTALAWAKVLTSFAVSLILNIGVGLIMGSNWHWVVGVSIVTAALSNVYNDFKAVQNAQVKSMTSTIPYAGEVQ